MFLAILYVMYAAYYEKAYWYPWDIPHMLLFGTACLALLEEIHIWLYFPLFLLDVPTRETSVHLLLLAAPVFLRRWGWKRAVSALFPLAGVWAAAPLPYEREETIRIRVTY